MAGWIRVGSILAMAMLAGCANGSKEDLLPQDGPTMGEVYNGHFRGLRGGEGGSPTGATPRGAADDADPRGYTRDAANEIESQFPRLPNPDLVMFVFPHISDRGYPVPGYSTVIPMYETVEYALPGEKEGW